MTGVRLVALLTLVIIASLVIGGCAAVVGPRVTVVNDTDEVFTIAANGGWVGTVGPRARATLPVPVGEEPTEVTATNQVGQVLVSVGGTRAMWDAAIDGSMPMSSWQDLQCGRILIATEPFDETVPGPIPDPCP